MLKLPSTPLRLLPLLAAVASLGACAGHHGRPTESAAAAPVRNTYVAERRYTKANLHETWNDGDAEIDVELAFPAERGTFPLVLYLPGLGETAAGGATWRSTWAEAGYAVLSVQDKRFGATALASARARAGDFRSLAREDYAPAALARRIAAVEFAVAEVKRRAAAAQAPWSSIDAGRLAVVGFDLGAQTASVIAAGEAIPDLPPHTVLKPGAAILLSPYADGSSLRAGWRSAMPRWHCRCFRSRAARTATASAPFTCRRSIERRGSTCRRATSVCWCSMAARTRCWAVRLQEIGKGRAKTHRPRRAGAPCRVLARCGMPTATAVVMAEVAAVVAASGPTRAAPVTKAVMLPITTA